MEERLVPMNEILPGIKDWKCRVRVIKKLGAKQASNSPNKFQKLILGDGLGRTLDAVIFHDNIDRFKHVLQEGKVYMVKGAYVSDPKQYKNPLVTCNYQWTFRRDTSVMEEPNDSVPSCGLSFRTTTSCEFHKFISTKTLINTACVVIANQEPRTVAVKGQGKVIREYAVVDKELEPFVVTFWEDSISDEMYDRMEPISKRAPLLLLNFSVVPYYGLSLSSNAQSIVLDDPKDEMLIELERWKHENEDPINILVQSTSFFEKKVMRLPNQPLKMSTVEQILNTQENAYLHVKVKARVENEYQDYFYISCSVCSTKTVAMYGTEFMCYSTPCKNTRVANRSFRFSLVIFDATGQAEVTFMGKEAQKLLGLEPSEFYQKQNEFSTAQSDFLRKRLCNVVLLLKLKSRIFKDAPTFTVDAIEILPDDNGTTPEKTIIQCNTYSEQGQLKSAKRKLIYHGSSDSDSSIQMKIATKDKGKGKMNLESNVEHIKEDTVGYTLEDSDFSDDEKSISEIFGGERKKKFVVQSEDEDSENDSFGYEQESTQKDKHEVIKKIKNTPVSKIKGSVRLDLTQDPANDAHWFSKDGDPSAHIGHISDHVDTPENFRDANSDMPLSLELLKAKKKGKSIETKIQCEVNMKMKDSQVGTLHRSKQNFMAGSPKKTRFPKEKNKQVTKALSAMEERMKSKISKDKEKSLPTIPQTPPLKSRSGRTIKKKLLD